MQVFRRQQNVLIIGSTFFKSTEKASAATTILRKSLAEFHSTGSSFEKRKNEFGFDCVRYSVQQKRADTKKALKSILFSGGCPMSRTQIGEYAADQLHKKSQTKSTHKVKRANSRNLNRKHQKENIDVSEDNHERVFHPSFGKQGFSWAFRASEKKCKWDHRKFHEADSRNRFHLNHDSCILGSRVDRETLGLPRAGRLTVEDVKAAFRQLAVKWHPDKHQGPSKADAEEKFKECVDAYKSLCNALSA